MHDTVRSGQLEGLENEVLCGLATHPPKEQFKKRWHVENLSDDLSYLTTDPTVNSNARDNGSGFQMPLKCKETSWNDHPDRASRGASPHGSLSKGRTPCM